MAHAFLLEEQKWIFGMPILMITMEPFISPQFIQDGMMEEQFTFTIRFVLLMDRRKPWSGQHNCTSIIPSMNKCMNKVLTTIMVLPKQQQRRYDL
ncbi:MAG: hypothetical protein WCD19_09845 [Nitrososphaeraceae archaeon]